MMERLPDQQAILACRYDARWRLALALPETWQGINPSTLVYFRRRVAEHGIAQVARESGLEAMRSAGYLRRHGAVRIDSTHVLGWIAHLSRLECVRETLRLALDFLVAFGGGSAWEPWFSRYADRNPQELRNASVARLRSTLDQAGREALDVLAKTPALGDTVVRSEPVALLQRVFDEQFEITAGASLQQRTYYYFAWARAVCAACPMKDQCLSPKKRAPFRALPVGEDQMIVQERRALCKTVESQRRLDQRSGIEGTHSELTRGYRLRRSRYRGLRKTDIQMQFTAAACNLHRWAARLCWLDRQQAMRAA